MDEIKTNPAMDEKVNPDSLKTTSWKPETWGGPRPGSGRPTLGGDEDPTVTVTVMMPRSLKKEAIRLGDGNMSRGIRRAIATLTLVNTEQWYKAIDARPLTDWPPPLSQPVEE